MAIGKHVLFAEGQDRKLCRYHVRHATAGGMPHARNVMAQANNGEIDQP